VQMVESRAGLLPMEDKRTRGLRIDRRMTEDLFVTDRGLSAYAIEQGTTLDRATIKRAIEGGASPDTYDKIESLLDRMEALKRLKDADDLHSAGDDLVEYRASGNFGVEFVVKGPVRDREVLKADLLDLIKGVRGDDVEHG
jgi:hypothetical protein